MLKLALSKGRVAEQVCRCFNEDSRFSNILDLTSRKLLFEDKGVQIILVKASDLPIYVESGAVDLGIVGKDVLMEGSYNIFEIIDLKIAKCKMILGGLPNQDLPNIKTVASKYPKITLEYFNKKRNPVEIVKLDGSVELAPLVGLSDAIVDITETGSTLRENGLVIYDEICDISSRLIANPVRYKLMYQKIKELEDFFREKIGGLSNDWQSKN